MFKKETYRHFIKNYDLLFKSSKCFFKVKPETQSYLTSKLLRYTLFLYFLHSSNKNNFDNPRKSFNDICSVGKNFYSDYLRSVTERCADKPFENLNTNLPNSLFSNKDRKGILDLFDKFNYSVEGSSEDHITPEIIEDLYQKYLEDTDCKITGTHYTPKTIVKYMCSKSLAYYFQNKESDCSKEFLLNNIKVYDPACGSGRFLTSMVNEIKDLFIKEKGGKVFDFLLHLMKDSIYGSDIDNEAIQNTKLQLLLILTKYSQEFNLSRFKSVKFNLHTENSILKFHNKEKFDIVIGNPPYIRISSINKSDDEKIRKNYETVFGHYDAYIPFIEHGIKSLNDNGILSYITPNKFLVKRYANKLRPFILKEVKILELIDTSQARTFDTAAAYPVISIFSKKSSCNKTKIGILNDSSFEDYFQNKQNSSFYFLDKADFKNNPNYTFDIFIDNNSKSIFDKISENSLPLGSYSRILTGTPAIKKYYGWKDLIVSEGNLNQKATYLKFLNVSNIKPYLIEWGKEIRTVGKRLEKPYLAYDKELIGKNKWEVFKQRKIVIKGNAKKLTAAFDNEGHANLSLYAVMFNENHDDEITTLYHLGLLNSKLLNYWYCKKFASSNLSGNYINFNGIYLKQIPIYLGTVNSQKEIAKIVKEILKITSTNSRKNIEDYQKNIDCLIYDIYELSSKEINRIESFHELQLTS